MNKKQEEQFDKEFIDLQGGLIRRKDLEKATFNGCGAVSLVSGKEIKQFISTLLKKQKEKLQDQYAHPTEEGYCCACDYDIAGFEQKLRAERQAIIEMIDNIDIKNITPRELKLKIYKLLK